MARLEEQGVESNLIRCFGKCLKYLALTILIFVVICILVINN